MSRVTEAALGSLAGAAGLDTPTPQGRFRRSVRLVLATGGMAHGATIAGSAVLNVTFLTREVEATAPGAPEPATLTAGGGGLVLSLPLAREVARVRLKAPQPGDQVAAFRYDGAAVSEDAVASALHGGNGAALNVTDRGLILRRRNAGDHALTAAAVAGVVLRYAPVNPRLLVAVLADPAGEHALPPVAGPGGAPIFPAAMSSGAAFAGVLAGAFGRLAEAGPLPAPVEFDLILEADQPCAARIDALDLRVLLERRGFAGEPGKRVLRFRSGTREAQSVVLALPPAAETLGGTMTFSAVVSRAMAKAGGTPGPPPAFGQEGVAIGQGEVIAGRIDLAVAAVVTGAEIVLAATEPQTVVVARLLADRDGSPDAVLAKGGEVALTGARPLPVTVPFAPTAVPAGPVWLALSAPRGAAVVMLGVSGKGVVKSSGAEFAPVGPVAIALAAALRHAAPAGQPGTGLFLKLGGWTLTPDGETADLTAALEALPVPRPASVTIGVSAAAPAVVTLDPPILRYTLPD